MFPRTFLLLAVSLASAAATLHAASKPNIVFILCDDLGYGDVRCLNPQGKIATPNMDRLAADGMVFTDAHTSSAVCTPSRYAILTGRYNWRSRLQSGVLGGLSSRLIEPGRVTVAQMLAENGYATACIGKWHLGMDWVKHLGKEVNDLGIESSGQADNVDYTQPIVNGPGSVGFQYYYGISASLDMVPYTFIENDHVTAAPTEKMDFPMTLGREEKKTTRKGPGAPGFTAIGVLPALAQKAIDYIGQRALEAKGGEPFFLYLPLNAPHTPIAPSPEWQGRSGISPYADFVMETDWAVGEVLKAIDAQGLGENTLVMMASDNGCSPSANFPELASKGHNPSAQFRGYKADIYDGGHRVPFLARWPGHIKPGTKSDQIVCLVDFFATCAEIVGAHVSDNMAEDSVSLLPALLGTADHPLHEAIVHHSINGSFSIRQGNWKLELCSGSGGWSDPKPNSAEAKKAPPVQLYDLSQDIGERTNVQAEHTEVVDRLTRLLERYIADGRTTPGVPQRNAVPIQLWKDNPTRPKGQPAAD